MSDYPVKAHGAVFRGLRNRGCLALNGRVSEKAYIRRMPRDGKPGDTDGLSVGRTPVDAIYGITPHGIARMDCDHIRAIKNPDCVALDIEWDSPGHGNILHVPFYEPEMPDLERRTKIEALISKLAAISELLRQEDFEAAKREKEERQRQETGR